MVGSSPAQWSTINIVSTWCHHTAAVMYRTQYPTHAPIPIGQYTEMLHPIIPNTYPTLFDSLDSLDYWLSPPQSADTTITATKMLPASAKETRLGRVPCTGDNRKRGNRVRRTPSLKRRQVVGRGYIGGSLGLTYFFFAALGLLLGPRRVLGQEEEYVDGGDVSMTCSEDSCSCSGSSADDVEIKVFDYPTSGDRVRTAINPIIGHADYKQYWYYYFLIPVTHFSKTE